MLIDDYIISALWITIHKQDGVADGLAFVRMDFLDSGFGEEQYLFADAFADVQE